MVRTAHPHSHVYSTQRLPPAAVMLIARQLKSAPPDALIVFSGDAECQAKQAVGVFHTPNQT
jgi:hypothetical protein